MVGRRAAGVPLPDRPGPRRRAAGRVDAGQRVRARPSVRGRVVVLLEAFWAVGWTLAALIGYLVVPARRRRLALGAGARSAAGALRGGRAVGAARVGAVPGAARADRRGGGGRPPVRGRGRGRAGRVAVAAADTPPRRGRRCGQSAAAPGRRRSGRSGSASTSATTAPSSGCPACCSVPASRWSSRSASPCDHPGPAARLRGLGLPHREVGTAADAGRLPPRLGRRRGAVRRGRGRHRRPAHRHGAVVLQPGRLGSAVRRDPGGVSDGAAGTGRRCRRGVRPARVDRGAALRAAAAGRRGFRTRLRGVRRVLRGRGRGDLGTARTARPLARGGRGRAGPGQVGARRVHSDRP